MAQGWRGSYTRYREFFLNIAASYKRRSDIRAFLEIILSLFTIIVFLMFALKPTAITVINLLQQIKEKRITLVALTQKVSDLKTVNTIIQQNQNAIPAIDIAISDNPNPDIFSQQLEGLAIKNDVSLLGISVSPISLVGDKITSAPSKFTPLPNGVNEMSFSASVKGKFTNTISFLHNVNEMRIPVKIDMLDITSTQDNTGSSLIVVITGRLPYEKK